MKVYGARLSPFVRKVLVVLELKGLGYEQVDVFPGMQTPEFLKISPLGKIPALEDEALQVSDSTVICEYLEERYPTVSTLPSSPQERATARWLEEYADTRLMELCGGGIYLERVVKPMFFKQPTDQAKVDKTINELMPPVLTYLESQAPKEGFLFGDFGRVDISVISPIINATYAGYVVDATKWPVLAAYVERVRAHPVVVKILQIEGKAMAAMAKQ